jgi:ubiquinone/menaquinone biosynthesis C-methylase UbiE
MQKRDKMVNAKEQYLHYSKNETERFFWQTQNKYISKKEKSLLSCISSFKRKKVLEVGCAEGQNIKNIFGKNNYYGLDFSNKKIEFAKKNVSKNFVVGDALSIPFKANSFDIVFGRDILHHIEEKKKALSEMKRVSRKKIIIIEANGACPIMWLFGTFVKIEADVKNSKIDEIKKLLSSSGLKLTKIDYAEPFPFYRFMLHYRFGLSFLGNVWLFTILFEIIEKIVSVIIPKRFWGYIIYTAERR